jgi:hypothetical protein
MKYLELKLIICDSTKDHIYIHVKTKKTKPFRHSEICTILQCENPNTVYCTLGYNNFNNLVALTR